MHAVLFQVDFKPDWVGDTDAELDQVVAMTQAMPGFVRATWAKQETWGVSFVVMADEESARAMAAGQAIPPEASVTFRSVEVLEIARDV